ncbi:MAG: hypothetical protein ABJM29_18220 [Rhizobiaceae bacterium]
MYARVTHFKMKPGSVATAKAMIEPMKDKIMGLPGTVQFINSVNDDGSGCVVAIVESKEQSDANQESVAAIWAHFAEHLEAAPTPEGYEVFVNWSN